MYQKVSMEIARIISSYSSQLPQREDNDLAKLANMHEHILFNKSATELNAIVVSMTQKPFACQFIKSAMQQVAFAINSEYANQPFGITVSDVYDAFDELVGTYDDFTGRLQKEGSLVAIKHEYEQAVIRKQAIREERFYYKVRGKVKHNAIKLSKENQARFDAITVELEGINKAITRYVSTRFYVKPYMEVFMALYGAYEEALELELQKAQKRANIS